MAVGGIPGPPIAPETITIVTSAVCPNVEKVAKQQGMEGFIDGTPELTRMLISSLKKK